KGGDFFVDGLQGFVEVLGGDGKRKERINTEGTEERAQSSQRRAKGKRKTRTSEKPSGAQTARIRPQGCGTRAAADERAYHRANFPHPAETAAAERTIQGFGCGPVNSEQQGFSFGVNSMNSMRVSSGSYRLSCHLPSRPSLGSSPGFQPFLMSCAFAAWMSGTPRAMWFITPSSLWLASAGMLSMYSTQSVPSGTCMATQSSLSSFMPPCQ